MKSRASLKSVYCCPINRNTTSGRVKYTHTTITNHVPISATGGVVLLSERAIRKRQAIAEPASRGSSTARCSLGATARIAVAASASHRDGGDFLITGCGVQPVQKRPR